MALAPTTPTSDPARLLEGLNDAQREAVILTSGPLAIVAGAPITDCRTAFALTLTSPTM